MLESDVKLAVSEYLQYQMNMRKLWFSRLNSGDFIIIEGNSRRRIKGCGAGTSDFLVIMPGMVLFIETKSDKGKQSKDQIEFQATVEAQGAKYLLARSLDDVSMIIEPDKSIKQRYEHLLAILNCEKE